MALRNIEPDDLLLAITGQIFWILRPSADRVFCARDKEQARQMRALPEYSNNVKMARQYLLQLLGMQELDTEPILETDTLFREDIPMSKRTKDYCRMGCSMTVEDFGVLVKEVIDYWMYQVEADIDAMSGDGEPVSWCDNKMTVIDPVTCEMRVEYFKPKNWKDELILRRVTEYTRSTRERYQKLIFAEDYEVPFPYKSPDEVLVEWMEAPGKKLFDQRMRVYGTRMWGFEAFDFVHPTYRRDTIQVVVNFKVDRDGRPLYDSEQINREKGELLDWLAPIVMADNPRFMMLDVPLHYWSMTNKEVGKTAIVYTFKSHPPDTAAMTSFNFLVGR